MEDIKKSTTEIEKNGIISIYIMGKQHRVPENLTIMKAMEYAGYQYVRGCGCRGGICGACATVYRKPKDYHIYFGLACQTMVEPDMYLTQIPFYPANRAACDFEQLTGAPEEIFKLYPEIFRCLACNNCTKACPMDVSVMDVVSALKQGNIPRAAELSFNCIQCGLCASRCMGELPQYHIFQLARRISGSKIVPRAKEIAEAVSAVKSGRYDADMDKLVKTENQLLRKIYSGREIEPEISGDDWRPARQEYL